MQAIDELLNNSLFMLSVGIVVGTVVGIVGTFITSVLLIKANQKAEAGRKLREIFDEFLAWNEMERFPWYPAKWDESLKAQNAATREFRRFLKDEERVSFDEAWRNYFNPETGENPKNYYWNRQEELEKRIDTVVKFTYQNRILESLRRWL